MGNDIKNVAEQGAVKAHWLAQELDKVEGCSAPIFEGPFFNEFVLRVPNAKQAYRHLLQNNIFGGIKLKSEFPDLGETLLVSTTEMNTQEDLERYVKAMKTLEVK
jgi:glycine cleavage system pyridoxal-binding protein P